MFGHVQTRVDIWLDPVERRYGKGYQIVQSLYGIADGGVVGTGLGRGSPDKIPEAENDFIFAAIGEELGLIGATAILMSYLLIIGAGLRIALRTDRTFEKLLAVGLTTIVGVQAFIIMGGVIKVVPLTGITLAVRELRRIVAARRTTSCWHCCCASATPAPAASVSCPTNRRPVNAGRAGGSAVDGATPRRRRRRSEMTRLVNRKIRQLAGRADRLLRRAVRGAQLLAGRSRGAARVATRQHPRS